MKKKKMLRFWKEQMKMLEFWNYLPCICFKGADETHNGVVIQGGRRGRCVS